MSSPLTGTIASNQRTLFWSKAVLASLALALSALICVPMYPVPMYMLMPTIVMLSLFSDTKLAFTAAFLYVLEATLGLPVLSGGRIDPLWIVSPVAGYIITFPLVAFVISSLSKRFAKAPFVGALAAVFAGQSILYTFGIANLTAYVGWSTALAVGFYPFVLKALLTALVGASLCKIKFALRG